LVTTFYRLPCHTTNSSKGLKDEILQKTLSEIQKEIKTSLKTETHVTSSLLLLQQKMVEKTEKS